MEFPIQAQFATQRPKLPLVLRAPVADTEPPGGIPISRHHYGVIETDRELSPAELKNFDIEPV